MTVLVAYEGDKLLGYITGYTGENNSDMMAPENSFELDVAGTVNEARGKGIGNILTKTLINRCIEEGFENSIIAWKINNLEASYFWPKQGFQQTIAYRMIRRIDERIFWADGIKALK